MRTIWTLHGHCRVVYNSVILRPGLGSSICLASGHSTRSIVDHPRRTEASMASETRHRHKSVAALCDVPTGVSTLTPAQATPGNNPSTVVRTDIRKRAHLTILCAFLSNANIHSPVPQMHTANALKSLYTSIRTQHLLGKLQSNRISRLISLFGSLSLPDSSGIFRHPLAPRMPSQPRRTYWVFILMLIKDLQHLNNALDHSSRYWAIQAELGRAAELPKNDPMAKLQAIHRARLHYLGFHPIIAHPDIRLPYLQTLLASFPQHSKEIVTRLCDILRWHRHIHPRILALLWQVILKYGADLPAKLRVTLLNALRTRLAGRSGTWRTAGSSHVPPSGEVTVLNATTPHTAPFSVADYASVMTSLMLSAEPLSHELPIRLWAKAQALAAFDPSNSIEQQWSHLVLMALFNAPPKNANYPYDTMTQPQSPEPDISAAPWKLMFTFGALEKVLRSESPDFAHQSQNAEQLKHIVYELWSIWISVAGQNHPNFVWRSVIRSFLRFAGTLRDASLKDDCFRLCIQRRLWNFKDLEHHDGTSAMKQLMVEYLVTSVLCGQRNWVALFSDVHRFLPQYRTDIAMMLTRRLTTYDVQLAYQFFTFCSIVDGMDVASQDILALGTTLASQGLSRLMIDFLQDPRLTKSHARELVISLLRDVSRHRTQRVEASVAAKLADAVLHTFPPLSPPPLTLQRIIRNTLHLIAESGQPSKAVELTRIICRSCPSYLGSPFISSLIRRLLRIRQYRLATRVYFALQAVDQSRAAKLRPMLVLALAGRNASSLGRKLNRYRGQQSKIEKSMRALGYRMKSPSVVMSLKAVAILTRPPWDNHSFCIAAQILVRARRLAAAKALFGRTQDHLDPKARTAVGNIILHGASLRTPLRTQQGMRTVLDTLSRLKKHGFVPDKVTANIMLKAILRWDNAIDGPKLRAMFNDTVRGGHLPLAMPIDDEMTSVTSARAVSTPKSPENVSFERHVRPLYKTFIKAFYLRGDVRAAKTVIGYLKAAAKSTNLLLSRNLPGSSVHDSFSSIRATKRKLDDAFRTLDDAVGTQDSTGDRPIKKPHIARSLYSTLAKYGIKSRESKRATSPKPNEIVSKTAPRLSAILARAASHTRKAFPFTFTAPFPSDAHTPLQVPTAEYRPSSVTSFLSRLATFKLSTYSNKPPSIDAVAAAKCGWTNNGKDRLVCNICHSSWVVVGRDGMSRDAANTLVEKQRASLVDMHKDGCPWKAKQCDDSVYHIPLHSPAVMARDIRNNALALDSVMTHVEIKHPLTGSQIQNLRKVLDSLPPVSSIPPEPESISNPASAPPPPAPSETATLTSLFGWLLFVPAAEQPSPPSSFSRASSVFNSRAGTPVPTPRPSSPQPLIRFGTPAPKRDTSLLHCALCRRRVGLWAFAPPVTPTPVPALPQNASTGAATNNSVQSSGAQIPTSKPPPRRQFDLSREHRSYCPYVVKSTVLPSLPVPARTGTALNGSSVSLASLNAQSSSAIEGWRAVLVVVLRHGMALRHQVGSRENGESTAANEADNVGAMVAGVKSRGGKDLLRYVKGLLG